MKRGMGVVLAGLALVAGSCSSGPKGAQTYSAQADAAPVPGRVFQFSSFYPGIIKVRPGDTVVFTNKGGAPHTISFGVRTDRSNSPAVVTPKGENPAVFGGCVTSQAPSPKLTKCPTKTGPALPPYNGSGYWNGFAAPGLSQAPAAAKQVQLALSSTIAPGTYTFLCLLHEPMVGQIQVVGKDSDRLTPTKFDEARDSAAAAARADAQKIPAPPVSAGNALAGYSGGAIAVNEFYPKELSVKAGAKVTWKALSPFEPHTITFGSPLAQGGPGPFFAPSGTPSGGTFTGGKANSGIMGGDFPGPKEFSLVFAKKGKYSYLCELHPGMVGTVNVT